MNGNFLGKIAISIVIFSIAIFTIKTFNSSTNISQLLLPPIKVSATAQELLDSVTLSHSEVAVQEKGHLTRASFAIDNNSNRDIKNIEIICTLMDNAGNEQGRDKWVLYDTIKAQTNGVVVHTSKMFVSDRASVSQCQIVDLEIATAPLIAVHRKDTRTHGLPQDTMDTMHNGPHH